MIATTISNSISENPFCFRILEFPGNIFELKLFLLFYGPAPLWTATTTYLGRIWRLAAPTQNAGMPRSARHCGHSNPSHQTMVQKRRVIARFGRLDSERGGRSNLQIM